MPTNVNMSLDDIIKMNRQNKHKETGRQKSGRTPVKKLRGTKISVRNQTKNVRRVGSKTPMGTSFGWKASGKRQSIGVSRISKQAKNNAGNELSNSAREYIQQAVNKALRVSRGAGVNPRRGILAQNRLRAVQNKVTRPVIQRRIIGQGARVQRGRGFAQPAVREVVLPARQQRQQVIVKKIVQQQPIQERVIVVERPQRQRQQVVQQVVRRQPVKIVKQVIQQQPVTRRQRENVIVVERPVQRVQQRVIQRQRVQRQPVQYVERVVQQPIRPRVQLPQRRQRVQVQVERTVPAARFRDARAAKNERMRSALNVGDGRNQQTDRFESSSSFLDRTVTVRRGRGFQNNF